MPATIAAPETKTEPKAVANAELTGLLVKWANSDKKASGFFAQACQLAKDKKLSRPVIEASLKQARPDWAKSTYGPEISRILSFTKKENEKLLQEMVEGKKTVTEARKEITKKQLQPNKSKEDKLKEKVNAAAKFAAANAKELLVEVEDVDQEDEQAVTEANEMAKEAFLEQCGTAFEESLILTPLFGGAAPEGTAKGEGEGEGEEEEEEEGEDTE